MEAGGASPQGAAASPGGVTRTQTMNQNQDPSRVQARVPGQRANLGRTKTEVWGDGAGKSAVQQVLGRLRPQQETGEAEERSDSLPRGGPPAQERKILKGGLFGSRGSGMMLPVKVLPAMPKIYGRKDPGAGPGQAARDWQGQHQGQEMPTEQGEAWQAEQGFDHANRSTPPTTSSRPGSSHKGQAQPRVHLQAAPQRAEGHPVATVNQAMVAALAACQDEDDSTPSESNGEGCLSEFGSPVIFAPPEGHRRASGRLSMDIPAGPRRSRRLSLDESAARLPVSSAAQRAGAPRDYHGMNSPARDPRSQQHPDRTIARTSSDLRSGRNGITGSPLPPLARKPNGATPRGSATNTPRGSGVLQPVEDMEFPRRRAERGRDDGGEAREGGGAVAKALGWIQQQKERQGIVAMFQRHTEDPEFAQDFESIRSMLVGGEEDEGAAVVGGGARRQGGRAHAGVEGGGVFSRALLQVAFDEDVERMEDEREARARQRQTEDDEFEEMRSSFLGSKQGTTVQRTHAMRVSVEDELAPPPPIPSSVSRAPSSEPKNERQGPVASPHGEALRVRLAQDPQRSSSSPGRRAQITRPRLSVKVGQEDDLLTCKTCGCPCPPPGESGFWLWVEGPSSWGIQNGAPGAGDEASYGASGSLDTHQPMPAFGKSTSRSLSERQLQSSDEERGELLTSRSDQGGAKFDKLVQGRKGGAHRAEEYQPDWQMDPPSAKSDRSDRGPSRFEREASLRSSERHGRESPSRAFSIRSDKGLGRIEPNSEDASWMPALVQPVSQAVSSQSDKGSGRLEHGQDGSDSDTWRPERTRVENCVGRPESSRSHQGAAGILGRHDRGSGRVEHVSRSGEIDWETVGQSPMRTASTRIASGSEDESNVCPVTHAVRPSRRQSFQEGGAWAANAGEPLARHPSVAFPGEGVAGSGHLGPEDVRRENARAGERAPMARSRQAMQNERRGAVAGSSAAVKPGPSEGAGFDFSSGLSFEGVGSRRRSMERSQPKAPWAPLGPEEEDPSIEGSSDHFSDESSMPRVHGRYHAGKPELAGAQGGARGQGGWSEAEYLSYPLSKKEEVRHGRISSGDAREAAEKEQLARRATTGHLDAFQLGGEVRVRGPGSGGRMHYSEDEGSATRLAGELGSIMLAHDEIAVQKRQVREEVSLLKDGH